MPRDISAFCSRWGVDLAADNVQLAGRTFAAFQASIEDFYLFMLCCCSYDTSPADDKFGTIVTAFLTPDSPYMINVGEALLRDTLFGAAAPRAKAQAASVSNTFGLSDVGQTVMASVVAFNPDSFQSTAGSTSTNKLDALLTLLRACVTRVPGGNEPISASFSQQLADAAARPNEPGAYRARMLAASETLKVFGAERLTRGLPVGTR